MKLNAQELKLLNRLIQAVVEDDRLLDDFQHDLFKAAGVNYQDLFDGDGNFDIERVPKDTRQDTYYLACALGNLPKAA